MILRDLKNENINKPKKLYLITKILIFTKLPNPIRETRGLKLVLRTIPCLKFWAQTIIHGIVQHSSVQTEYTGADIFKMNRKLNMYVIIMYAIINKKKLKMKW